MLKNTWNIINPLTNPLIQSGEELADIDLVEQFAETLAIEVFMSLRGNTQMATVIAFATRKFKEKLASLLV